MISISVIICSYNPKIHFLSRVLIALKNQTLAKKSWELIIINNNSTNGFENQIDISWHPLAKVILETNQGLTPSRLRGIQESKGDILIFVDDDNILKENFLEKALEISNNWQNIGVWGGNIEPEFETQPEPWTKDYWYYLAIRHIDRDYWSNDIKSSKSEPCGAGLCIRKSVALHYISTLEQSPERKKLDRIKGKLISGGDTDMVYSALELGFGMGVFKDLNLIHIMPKERLEENYLVRLMEGLRYSHILLSYFRYKTLSVPKRNFMWNLKVAYNFIRLPKRQKRFYMANIKAENEALKYLKSIT